MRAISRVSPLVVSATIASIALATLATGCASGGNLQALRTETTLFRETVDGHNRIRRSLRPAPSPPLGALRWSSAAARVAAGWAERCAFRHNPNRGPFGENLFAMSGTETDAVIVARALRSWASESADYDPRSGRCRAGAVCGHYTQMVWRETRGVGCALARCLGGSPFSDERWSLVVCNYDPPGNVVGRRPF